MCISYYPILEFTGVLIKYWAQQHIHVKEENELSLQSVDENAGVEFHHSTWKPPGANGTSRGQKSKGKVSVMPCFFADSGQNTSLLQLDTFRGPGLASAFPSVSFSVAMHLEISASSYKDNSHAVVGSVYELI